MPTKPQRFQTGERGIRRLDVVELRNWLCAMGPSFGTFAGCLDSCFEQAAALDQLASKGRS